jgi:hypothetical protein
MKLWSRGLGKQELIMNFMNYDVHKDGQEVVISGRITEPVNWEFWIRFDENDVPGLIRVAKNPSVVGMVGRHWFKKVFLFWRRSGEKAAVETVDSPSPGSRAGASEDR